MNTNPEAEGIVRPDSARVEFRGVGGLEEEELVPIGEAINDLSSRLTRMYRNQTVLRSSAVRQVAALSTAGVKVIAARYRTGVAGSTSFAYYYWFKEVPAALTPEFLGTLPPTHPLFWIREPSDYAPERQPQDDNPSSLVKFAASSQGLRP